MYNTCIYILLLSAGRKNTVLFIRLSLSLRRNSSPSSSSSRHAGALCLIDAARNDAAAAVLALGASQELIAAPTRLGSSRDPALTLLRERMKRSKGSRLRRSEDLNFDKNQRKTEMLINQGLMSRLCHFEEGQKVAQ